MSERRVVVEVFLGDTGFEVRPADGFRLMLHEDLLYWSDAPCMTPGAALARFGEALDADLVRDGWTMPREDLDGPAVPEAEPSAEEIRERVVATLREMKYPEAVLEQVKLRTPTEIDHDLEIYPYAYLKLDAILDEKKLDRFELLGLLEKHKIRVVEDGMRALLFVWLHRGPLHGVE